MPDKATNGIRKIYSSDNVTRIQMQTILQMDYIQNKCAKTKLMIPNPPQKYAQRLNLLRILDKIINKRLTIVSAPAGYGKTTLVSMWANARKQEEDIVWVSLSEADNDVYTFWLSIVLALQECFHENMAAVLTMFIEDGHYEVSSIITAIINGMIANSESECVLILDDYHLIKDNEINRSMKFFISNIPSNIHLVMVTRTKPHLPLAKMRIKEELLELNEEAIRFNSMEIAELYNKMLGKEFDEKLIKKIETSTEGWIIAIKLLAHSLNMNPENLDNILNHNSGYIIDYLSEEIIEQIDEDYRRFLYKTSILPVLSGPICNYLLGISNSQEILDKLVEENMFIVVLNEESGYYRYHHLFSNFLLNKLEKYHSNEAKELHLKASKWFEDNGDFYEALNFSFKAKDHENSARLIEACVEKITARGEFYKLINIVETLPISTLEAKPKIYLYYAMALAMIGRFDEKESELERMNPDLFHDKDEGYKGAIYAIRAIAAYHKNGIGERKVEEYAQKALSTISENDSLLLLLRAFAYIYIGCMNVLNGNRTAALDNMRAALDFGKRVDNLYIILNATCRIASFRYIEGNPKDALTICEDTILYVSKKNLLYPSTSLLFWLAGVITYELNDIERAFNYIAKSIECNRNSHDITREFQNSLFYAKILYAQGKLPEAAETLGNIEKVHGYVDRWNMFKHHLSDIVRLYVNIRGEDSLILFEDKYRIKFEDSFGLENEEMNIAAVEVLLYRKGYEEADMIINKLLQDAKMEERKYSIIKLLVLDSICKRRQGGLLQSVEIMREAVSSASSSGYQRIFLEFGDEVMEILSELLANLGKTENGTEIKAFLITLVSSYKGDVTQQNAIRHERRDSNPFSPRELEVLDCIVEGLTNIEISRKLYISTSTVKKHIKNIYEKLNVNNRTKAINAIGKWGLD